jgi:hypothetical protein
MSAMSMLFMLFLCAAVAGPLVAWCWAMRRRECPNCGASIEADPALMRMMTGE